MFRTLKILSILLKMLMLMRAVIAFYSENQEDQEDIAQNIPSFEFYTINDYLLQVQKIYMQEYFNNVTEKNVVVFQEDSTLSSDSILSNLTLPIRTFVEFDNNLIKKNICVTFRSDKFKNDYFYMNYRIQYWSENLNQTIQINITDIINVYSPLEYKVYDLKTDTTYYFNIEMSKLKSEYVNFINVSTTHENPIPLLLVYMVSDVDLLDVDLQIGIKLDTNFEYKDSVYSALEHKIYGVNFQSELITSDFNPTAIQTSRSFTTIAKVNSTAQRLCFDWIQRKLYWVQKCTTGTCIIKLDLTLWEQMGIVKYDEINISKEYEYAQFLHILPSTGYMYWSFYNQIMRSDLDGKNMKSLTKDNKCFCDELRNSLSELLQIDTTNIEPLIYWHYVKGVIVTDIDGCKCYKISNFRNIQYLNCFTFDETNIYFYDYNKKVFHILKKPHRFFENKEHELESVHKIRYRENYNIIIYKCITLTKILQTYPQRICLTPKMKDYRIQKAFINATSIEVILPEPILNDGCKKHNLPTTIYHISVSYLTRLDNGSNKIEQSNVITYERHYEFKNLIPFTEYTLNLALSNFYFAKLSMDLQFGSDVKVTTKMLDNEILTVQYIPLILSLAATIVIYNVYYFYCCEHRQRKRSKQIIRPSIINIESTTANKTSFVNYELHSVHDPKLQTDIDEFASIIIDKKQITLGNLLGSGAFGKVYQGIVKNEEGLEIMPVAIKMLRENASSQEKKGFLEEAKLMKEFDHKHVLKLLGICIAEDQSWLILELMEAGDLLKYLRETRTLHPEDPHALRIQDLLAMCEDVARGCRYLEERHYVHRDLACRNCLISSRIRENRVVKISDFGLAKDVYSSDYYRTGGEVPLPYRWMAPESLMDRIFTSQSDVWSFGELMWEITSLGQHPYAALYSFNEVKEHVCAGYKLLKPCHCPEKLYDLMLNCWNAANDRPNFMICLETIVTLKNEIEDAILHSPPPSEYRPPADFL